MKNIIKLFLVITVVALSLTVLAGCNIFDTAEACEHKWVEATCEAPKTCSICKATEGKALGHTEEVLIGKDATCTEAGLTEGKKCTVCAKALVEQSEIPSKGHTEEVIKGTKATCTETGLTEGKKCSVCYEILVRQEEIPVVPHTEEVVPGKAATCTDKGLTEGKKCSVCEAVIVAQEEISELPHAEVIVAGKAATCTEKGLTDGKKCSVCETVLLAQEEIPSKGHKDEDGNYECDVCEADLCTEHVPADAVEENRIEATCTSNGSYDLVVKCAQCGEEISREAKVIEKLAHTEEVVAGKDATCTEAGLTEGKKCSVCGEVLVAQKEIESNGHTEEVIKGKDATCTETGLTDGKKCSVCGETLEEQQFIDYLKHIQGEWIVTTYPSCDKEGQRLAQCTVCDSIVAQESIPASHTFVEGVCTVCELIENIILDKEFIPAEEAKSSILVAPTWWKGGGYEDLTDGIKDADNAPGRFSTIMKTSGMMDATISLGGAYLLDSIRFYTYDPDAGTGAGSLGKDLLIQVYSMGEWKDVIVCADNAAIASYLVVNEGMYNDYLEFDLGGIRAEKIRFYISASASGNGTTFEEIECSAKEAPHEHSWVDATCVAPKTCSSCGATEGEALPHTEVIDAAVAQTCTSTGLTEGKHCSVCNTVLVAQKVVPMHNLVNGVCADCGYAPNVFAGKFFVPSADAAGNIFSAAFGYQTITDGIIFEEGKGRFSSKQNGGKVEATIDLGAVYDLNEFKVYLYWNTGVQRFGSGFKIEVLFGGEWTTVVNCESVEELQAYWVDNPDSVDKEWLIFDLGGVAARQLRFTIPSQTSVEWTTFYEMECSAKVSEKVEPEPEEPVFVENIFAGKQFVPTSDALANVLAASWWKGGGYETLTDGIKNVDNDPGRFSTVMNTTGMMDATIDLGESYELHSLKFYTYDKTSTGAGSVGADLLIQVYANGEWKDVVVCADNASVMSHLVAGDGAYDDYLEFDLGGIVAEKVRIYISASSSSSGTTYEEIECNGYEK